MYVYNRHKISVRYLSHWIKYQMTSGHGPRKPWTWAGLRPVPTLWLDQPPLGMSKKTDCLKRRASDAPSLFFWRSDSLEHGLNICGTRRSYASRFRGYALQRAPVRWTLTSEPTIGGGLRLCQSRNGATNSTIAEESFPGDVTQPSQVSTREQPKEHEPTTWNPKQRTHAGKRNQLRACFKPIQASTNWIPNPD